MGASFLALAPTHTHPIDRMIDGRGRFHSTPAIVIEGHATLRDGVAPFRFMRTQTPSRAMAHIDVMFRRGRGSPSRRSIVQIVRAFGVPTDIECTLDSSIAFDGAKGVDVRHIVSALGYQKPRSAQGPRPDHTRVLLWAL